MTDTYYIDYEKLSDLEKELKVSVSTTNSDTYVKPLYSFDILISMINLLLYPSENSNTPLAYETLKKLDILKEVTE